MPSIAKCPRCGREHSVDEYEADRFCRNCGTLLQQPTIQTQTGGWKRLFPYEPYPEQKQFMDDVENITRQNRVIIAEACNGFGKTVSALSSLLSVGKPVVYTTRTHDQVRQVLSEVERINSYSKENFTAVNLASREHLCLNQDCKGIPSRDAQELCQMLRKDGECPYLSDSLDLPRNLPPILGVETLTEVGKRYRLCPYFLARRASKTSRVVVAPYPYVFDPKIRFMTGLDLEGRVLVLDEGHNIDQVAQDTFSDTLTDRTINSAGDELKSIGMPRTLMKRLSEHLEEIVSEEPLLRRGVQVQADIESALGGDLFNFVEQYAPAVEAIRENKQKAGNPPISYLNSVLSFIELLTTSRKDKYIAIYRKSSYGANQIEYRCLDPSMAIKPLVDGSSGMLIMSGTLSPLELFADIIGLQNAELRSYPSIQRSKEIRMIIDTRVTTTYRERSNLMLQNIGKSVSEQLPNVPNGALIFFPQREFMNRCLDVWGANGLIKISEGLPFLGSKQLFREGNDAKQNLLILNRYKSVAVTPAGSVLCCVFRGRNSEGSNFPNEQARGIFLLGVPYANYADPIVKAQMNYYEHLSQGLGNRWYMMDAFRAANQALGRGIRSRDDWCHYWLLDSRYAQNINLISTWAKGEEPEIITK
jgi:Rad3-related DNA helicase